MNVFLTTSVVSITHITVPFLILWWVLKGKIKCKLDWIVKTLITAAYITIFFIAGYWIYISYYFRFIIPILLIMVLIKSFLSIKQLDFIAKKGSKAWIYFALKCLMVIYLILCTITACKGLCYSGESLNLSFPLKDGMYYVSDGGSNIVLNQHQRYGVEKYKYDMDIEKLNYFGTMSKGIFPKELDKFNIYGETIYSPCDGSIIDAFDGSKDFSPLHNEVTEGNYIDLSYKDFNIHFAHLKQGSLLVNIGDTIKKGQPIARVGNSGFTEMPHLHIRVQKNGISIPITFNRRFLVRNSLFFSRK